MREQEGLLSKLPEYNAENDQFDTKIAEITGSLKARHELALREDVSRIDIKHREDLEVR